MMNETARLLIVDDDDSTRVAITASMNSIGFTAETADTYQSAIERCKSHAYDAIVCDVNLPDRDGFDILRWVKANAPSTAVIMFTGFASVRSAVEAIREGASEYITKPDPDGKLESAVNRILQSPHAHPADPASFTTESTNMPTWLEPCQSDKMREIDSIIESVADTNTTVLLLGENGTGKTVTARAIHQKSSRRNAPFVEVACGALPEDLLESELFGHVAGAFTGAHRDREGKFLAARGGTIFLDEIGTASPAMQVKLLRVLQDRVFEPVGGNRTYKVDARFIFATNEDLEEKVRRGEFRMDLFFRINVLSITQPPLRERKMEIPVLAQKFIEQFNRECGKHIIGVNNEARQRLVEYSWPGNIRELMNAVERAVVLAPSNVITEYDLPDSIRLHYPATPYSPANVDTAEDHPNILKMSLQGLERQAIIDALNNNGWVRKETAKQLKISRSTLYKKMQQFHLR